jgi:hypothetical protein
VLRFAKDRMSCEFAFNFDPLFALKNEPAVTAHLPERSIDFGFLVDQAAVQISVEIGSIFDAIQQLFGLVVSNVPHEVNRSDNSAGH